MPWRNQREQVISHFNACRKGQLIAIGFQIGEVVDDGVQEGLFVLGEGLGEGAGGGLGGLGGGEGVHLGFLAQFLEVQLRH